MSNRFYDLILLNCLNTFSIEMQQNFNILRSTLKMYVKNVYILVCFYQTFFLDKNVEWESS